MKLFAKSTFAYLAAVFLAGSCFAFGAWGSHKSSDSRTTNITFESNVKFDNGVSLPAGTYRVSVPKNQQTPNVTFSQDGKVVATAQAKVVDESKKNYQTEIDGTTQGDAEQISAIRPSGWQEEIVFGNSAR